MEHKSLRYWLGLWQTHGVGPATFAKLLTRFPDLQELFNTSPRLWDALNFSPALRATLERSNWEAVDLALQWANQPNCHIITWLDNTYPPLLKEIVDAPPILFLHGNPGVLSHQQIALVGSRNPSTQGETIAHEIAYELAHQQFCITSGLALGIDYCSHVGALTANGYTCAVLGTGIDQIYPKRHQKLAEKIRDNGVLVSEFPLGTPAKANHFPRRNRLISGLSLGTVVIEAALRSGSLITARYALEQNREVFAVPSSIYNPVASGCHHLIQQGAKLTKDVSDILNEIQLHNLVPKPVIKPHVITQSATANKQTQTPDRPTFLTKGLDSEQQKLVKCIGFTATSVEYIANYSGLAIEKVLSILTNLELTGYVRSTSGGYIRVE